ncbi:hypothetical protein ABL78_5862 [Leptomonas seymouri]|uniref:Uncharacterized protein n=1 Tax=Leptomonas seymouri TaxID=5684 RepID=A0A0N0P4B3_LEPSE|nr:hypothetical protein ABL78_5862 [Leptomonas seymouri]|eukprot:KPI85096.1 hypothetical protein ABL78_5862 [Leptomonas seymouri]
MLRRLILVAPGASASLPALRNVLCGRQHGRLLHISPVVLNSSTPSGNSEPRSAAEEDKEELERERHLRERFAEKVQHGIPQPQPGGADSAFGPGFGSGPTWGMGGAGSTAGQSAFTPDAARKMFNFLFYLTALLFLMIMVPLSNQKSTVYTMQGLPWWELPIGSAAYFILLRALYSRPEQDRIKTEFENAARANPTLTFDQFMTHNYPNMFQGYRTPQPEIVAAVSACLSSAKDLKFAQTMVRAAGRAKDPRASADDVMDALRRDFPQLF